MVTRGKNSSVLIHRSGRFGEGYWSSRMFSMAGLLRNNQQGKAIPSQGGNALPCLVCCNSVNLGGCAQSGLRLPDQRGESGCVVHGEIGEHLAIQLDAGLLQAVDQLRVRDAVDLRGGVDAHNPDGAVLPLLALAAAVGKLQPALDSFLRCLVQLGFGEEVAARPFQDFLAAVIAFCPTFYARHRNSPLVTGSAAGGEKYLFTRYAIPIHSSFLRKGASIEARKDQAYGIMRATFLWSASETSTL